eukprot:gene624-1289_t
MKLSVFLTLYGWTLLLVQSSEQCPQGLELKSVCADTLQPTCDNKVMPQAPVTSDCITKFACRCPATSPFRWKNQCYKGFECPNKGADAPSDNIIGHNFIVAGQLLSNGFMYASHISALKLPQHWYHGIALFQVQDPHCITVVQKAHADNPSSFLSLKYLVPTKLVDLLTDGNVIDAKIGLNAGRAFRFIKQCKIEVKKVLDLRRYKASQPSHPQYQRYFLFGDGHGAFMSHIPTKCFDFQQVIALKSVPSGLTIDQLRNGVAVEIPSLPGHPSFNSNNFVMDPLTAVSYDAIMSGASNADALRLSIGQKYVFDFFIVNIGC